MYERPYSIHTSAAELPPDWDEVAGSNIFLRRCYLAVLERAAPGNMTCRFIGLWDNGNLCGVAVVQVLDFSSIQTFGARDHKVKNAIRTFFFKRFSSRVLIVGNNMLTGENAFRIPGGPQWLERLADAVADLEAAFRPHLTIWKDFYPKQSSRFEIPKFKSYFRFSTQPNMVLDFNPAWRAEADYVAAFLKKYRDQYKRARKKFAGVTKKRLSAGEIAGLQTEMHALYLTVALNAPFNTFFLSTGHFHAMKQCLGDDFQIDGYFFDDVLIGFSTTILNGSDVDTYFLGYEEHHQKDRMLYLNMLYDMVANAISIGSERIILARTALEIKSSVGATPRVMFGFIRHRNPFLNRMMAFLFPFFEPKQKWQQRHPFKPQEQPLSSGAGE